MFSLFITYIKRSFSKRPLTYSLLLFMEITSIVCVLFVFGMIYRAYTVFEDSDRDERTITAVFEDEYAMTLEEQLASCIDGATFKSGASKVFDNIDYEYELYSAYGLLEYDGATYKFNVSKSSSTLQLNQMRLL